MMMMIIITIIEMTMTVITIMIMMMIIIKEIKGSCECFVRAIMYVQIISNCSYFSLQVSSDMLMHSTVMLIFLLFWSADGLGKNPGIL